MACVLEGCKLADGSKYFWLDWAHLVEWSRRWMLMWLALTRSSVRLFIPDTSHARSCLYPPQSGLWLCVSKCVERACWFDSALVRAHPSIVSICEDYLAGKRPLRAVSLHPRALRKKSTASTGQAIPLVSGTLVVAWLHSRPPAASTSTGRDATMAPNDAKRALRLNRRHRCVSKEDATLQGLGLAWLRAPFDALCFHCF